MTNFYPNKKENTEENVHNNPYLNLSPLNWCENIRGPHFYFHSTQPAASEDLRLTSASWNLSKEKQPSSRRRQFVEQENLLTWRRTIKP